MLRKPPKSVLFSFFVTRAVAIKFSGASSSLPPLPFVIQDRHKHSAILFYPTCTTLHFFYPCICISQHIHNALIGKAKEKHLFLTPFSDMCRSMVPNRAMPTVSVAAVDSVETCRARYLWYVVCSVFFCFLSHGRNGAYKTGAFSTPTFSLPWVSSLNRRRPWISSFPLYHCPHIFCIFRVSSHCMRDKRAENMCRQRKLRHVNCTPRIAPFRIQSKTGTARRQKTPAKRRLISAHGFQFKRCQRLKGLCQRVTITCVVRKKVL